MKLVKYFLQKKSVTLLRIGIDIGGRPILLHQMGKLEDAPFTIKQALVLTPYPGASPSEVQSQVTDILEESIQSLSELYYLKTEESRRALQNHRLCEKRNPGRRDATTMGQITPQGKRCTK